MRAVCILLVISATTFAGCSTSKMTPDIETFGTTVKTIIGKDKSDSVKNKLQERVDTARLEDFARAGVLYRVAESSEAACSYNEPALRPSSFADSCKLEPVLFDQQTSQQIIVSSQYDSLDIQSQSDRVIPAGNQKLLKELLADRLKSDLLDYAGQIKALATATEPNDVATAAGNALDAVHALGDEIDRTAPVTGSEASKRRTANRNLLVTLTSEALEVWRYNLLKKILMASDEDISRAAMQLAILSFEKEKTDLEKDKDVFQAALLDQSLGSRQSLESVQVAFARLAEADSNASFRRYADIATTHNAIIEALMSPMDLTQLAATNKRIVELSKAIRDAD